MILWCIGIAALIVTFLGGWFALKFKDKLHLILGFSAGAVVGVAFFDLLPEAVGLAGPAYGIETVASMIALGFAGYLVLDRLAILHFDQEEAWISRHHRGWWRAGSLSLHSLLDGVAIGLAFKVSVGVGIAVAMGIVVHDFSDGINTVSLIFRNDGNRRLALCWLAVDALAPGVGILATGICSPTQQFLGLVLAVFCGFFLYIGASDLLPESHHEHPALGTTIMTIAGITVLYAAMRLARF